MLSMIARAGLNANAEVLLEAIDLVKVLADITGGSWI